MYVGMYATVVASAVYTLNPVVILLGVFRDFYPSFPSSWAEGEPYAEGFLAEHIWITSVT